MAIDSTAELLFNITADADDAAENITRFRELMGTSIDDMAAQFKGWADETIGEIDSVKAAMTAGIAAIAAGVLAAGVSITEATKDYSTYAEQIYKARTLTGLQAEDLSALHEMAAKTGTNFEELTKGLGRFAANILLASQGSQTQMHAFAALGISQKDVIAGQKDMLPLLEKVMDAFKKNASAVQTAALARDLFGKGGTAFIEMLKQGSAALEETIKECKEYGLTLSGKDIDAAHAFTVSQTMLKAQLEGVATTIGKTVMPWLEKMSAAVIAASHSWKDMLKGLLPGGEREAVMSFADAYHKAIEDIENEVRKARTGGAINLIDSNTFGKVKEAKQEYFGLTELVESLKTKIAEQGTGWDRLANEVEHYREQIAKATAELDKMKAAGKITPDSYDQQKAALLEIPPLLERVIKDSSTKLAAEDSKAWGEAMEKTAHAFAEETAQIATAAYNRQTVLREIRDREATEDENNYAAQRARLAREMDDWAAAMAKKTALTAEDWDAIDRITAAGLDKIDKSEAAAFQQQLQRLKEHLDQTGAANATAAQKLWLDYQKELEQYSTIEEAKVLKTAQTEAQVVQIQQMYAQIRAQLLQKYQNDLQQLTNSQGFQSVFGSYFAGMIKQDSDLMRNWSTSTNQSVLLVKVALQSLQEQAKKTFDQFVQGMGQTMVQAIVTGKSISKAMEQMLVSTVESFAAQAMTAAIMATAWGFYDLAIGDYAAAGEAFTAAAIFGSVGTAAAIAGKYMNSASGGASASGAGAGGGSSRGSSYGSGSGYGGGGGYGQQQQQQQPYVNVTVEGHVIGPNSGAMLADIINQAVYGNSTQLYASHNPQGVPL